MNIDKESESTKKTDRHSDKQEERRALKATQPLSPLGSDEGADAEFPQADIIPWFKGLVSGQPSFVHIKTWAAMGRPDPGFRLIVSGQLDQAGQHGVSTKISLLMTEILTRH
ncbi:hypothetical protein RRG08_057558 [Elysia crispata]|uniref:Uncharacterized protein n=1 Tax=Elysia crispata TaxID=231223 RepID=A0AAE0XNT8_9GAST|nr:hypothetical protein RRG08_057558 [Elysia crispata]